MTAQVYYVEYNLLNAAGETVDSSRGGVPLVFLEGANQVISGLEKAVSGRCCGDILEIEVPPEQAYGPYRQELVQALHSSQFSEIDTLKPGMLLQTQSGENRHVVKVLEMKDEQVIIDANHPLAGLTLRFEAEIKAVRNASEEELKQGFATL
jgi:FKBP-type peptidyl-prolyl cis-trans isomerase SlyD